MDRDAFARLSAILDQVLELSDAERRLALDRLCAGDPLLRRQAEQLLAADREPSGLLDAAAEAYSAALAGEGEAAEARGGRIGPYRVLAELGRGGMGVVYLAERADGQFAQRLALKVLKRGMDSEEVVARFLAERQILAQLEHPGIARLLDGGMSEDGRPYFAMEYVDGVPITRWCQERGVPLIERLRLFEPVCRAVEYAHRNLVVHRDLKPANILVTPAGEVKLLDFGIAKLLAADASIPSLTRAGFGPLTPEYAAPEQLLGEAITTATDVYGLGTVLYELVAGRRPFAAHEQMPQGLERALSTREPERPSSVLRRRHPSGEAGLAPAARRRWRGLAGDLDTLVLSALRREPERRYSSAEALREDLSRLLDGLPLCAHPDSFAYRARKFVGRHRLAVAAGAFSGLSLVAGLGATAWQARLARAEAARATATRDFLVSLFAVSDPDVAKGEQISARMLLDAGASRVEKELARQPALEAEMMGLVGELYLKLGSYDRAAPLLERQVELQGRVSGPEHPDMAASLARLAVLRRAQGRLEESERLLRTALAAHGASSGRRSPATARAVAALAELLSARGKADEAAPLFEEALELLSATVGRESLEVADALNGKALLLAGRGDFAGAVPLLEEALRIRRAAYGERHSRVAQSLGNLAALRDSLGEHAAAAEDLRQVLDLRRALHGEEHPAVAEALGNLGATLGKLGRYEEAEGLQRQALALQERSLGVDNPQLAATCYNLGRALLGQGRFAAAEPALRRAAGLNRRLVGDDHPLQARVLTALARALAGQAKVAEAEELFGRAVAVLRAAGGGAEPQLAEALAGLGTVRLEAGRAGAAEPLLAEALAISQRLHGPEDRRTRAAAAQLQACRAELERGRRPDSPDPRG